MKTLKRVIAYTGCVVLSLIVIVGVGTMVFDMVKAHGLLHFAGSLLIAIGITFLAYAAVVWSR